MNLSLRLLAASALLAIGGIAFATAPSTDATANTKKPRTAQQQRMADCNKQATGKHGDDRRAFMSSCLKGETTAAAAAAKPTRQSKMATCNADAKTNALKGDERKAFMSECLKSKAEA